MQLNMLVKLKWSQFQLNLTIVNHSSQTSFVLLAVLKLIFMSLSAIIVLYIGTLPLRSSSFRASPFLRSMGTTFAGAIFFNVAMLNILPKASATINQYLKERQDKQVFPLANLLVITGFLITIALTKIISTHSQHHQQPHTSNPSTNSPNLELNELFNQIQVTTNGEGSQVQKNVIFNNPTYQFNSNRDVYILTFAMYFHTFFEGIALGEQDDIIGFLSLATALILHKWADALSMGIHYFKRNVDTKLTFTMIFGQAFLILSGICFGWIIDGFGNYVQAIFLSISAGIFLAISFIELLNEQLNRKQYRMYKFGVLVLGTMFISVIWYCQHKLFVFDKQ